MSEPLQPLAYSVPQAVTVSGLSRAYLYRLIREGALRSVKIGGRRLVPAEALKELLKAS